MFKFDTAKIEWGPMRASCHIDLRDGDKSVGYLQIRPDEIQNRERALKVMGPLSEHSTIDSNTFLSLMPKDIVWQKNVADALGTIELRGKNADLSFWIIKNTKRGFPYAASPEELTAATEELTAIRDAIS